MRNTRKTADGRNYPVTPSRRCSADEAEAHRRRRAAPKPGRRLGQQLLARNRRSVPTPTPPTHAPPGLGRWGHGRCGSGRQVLRRGVDPDAVIEVDHALCLPSGLVVRRVACPGGGACSACASCRVVGVVRRRRGRGGTTAEARVSIRDGRQQAATIAAPAHTTQAHGARGYVHAIGGRRRREAEHRTSALASNLRLKCEPRSQQQQQQQQAGKKQAGKNTPRKRKQAAAATNSEKNKRSRRPRRSCRG